jgi:hypothetical protein
LSKQRREQTLQSLAFTLNRIFLQDHARMTYPELEEDNRMELAAEETPNSLS